MGRIIQRTNFAASKTCPANLENCSPKLGAGQFFDCETNGLCHAVEPLVTGAADASSEPPASEKAGR